MTLVQNADELGLWTLPGAAREAPGLHALVIGISAYPHLRGGDARAGVANDFGMGQLLASARTAARVFAWLAQQTHFTGRPILSCRLLLAPQPKDETDAVKALVGDHYGPATFTAMAAAIKAWAESFLWVKAAQAKTNASLMFFSGHGLEYLSSPSLVASDFLKPPGLVGADNAVAIKGILDPLRTFNLGASFYFFDCCRNAPPDLMKTNPVGQSVLKSQPTFVVTPKVVAWMQATTPGAFAFQPNNPKAEATFFGQALMEGLMGVAPDWHPYDVSTDPGRLDFQALQSYVMDRTDDLLKSVNPALDQAAQGSGDPYWGKALLVEAPISNFKTSADPGGPSAGTVMNVPGGLPGAGAPIEIFATRGGFNLNGNSGPSNLRFRAGRPPPRGAENDRALGNPIAIESPLDIVLSTPGLVTNIVGNDDVGRILARSFDAMRIGGAKHQRLDVLLRTARTRAVQSSMVITFDLSVAASSVLETIWIEIGGGDSGWPRFAVAVPSDLKPVPVRLQFVLVKEAPDLASIPAAFSARIGAPLPDLSPQRAATWAAVRAAQEAGVAEPTLLPENVGKAVLDGTLSPLAAVIVGFQLLRTGDLDLSQDWPRRLASRFLFVDAAVLWAEVLARRAEANRTFLRDATLDELMDQLQAIGHVGPPRIGSALMAALERVEQLRSAFPDREPGRLARVAERLLEIGPYARSRGTFAAFGPLPDGFDPRRTFDN